MIKEKDANTPKSQNTWCRVMGSNAFGLVGNVGISSVLKNGTQVYCIFDDDDRRKQCYVIGTVIGISNPSSDTKDTNGVHPEGDQGMPDIHPLMQGDYDSYSKTQIISTESGHMIRMCDIQGSEQIDIFHTSGSCISMLADGSIRINAKKDLLIDVGGEMKTNVKGDLGTEVSGTHNFLVKGTENYAVGGQCNCTVTGKETKQNKGGYDQKVMGTNSIKTTGLCNMDTTGIHTIQASRLAAMCPIFCSSTGMFAGDVKAMGVISLKSHTHMYTHGGLAAGPDVTMRPLPG
jgi:hypothetical protein